ncbi:hypothetical protein SAMN02910355_1892 [Terrisporobacter glycolicus]|nr:hypothetical protein SAMN02910355_1892 [Terrisporobacter glycolicus]
MNDLKNITSKELVEELKNREGVEMKIVDPHQEDVIEVNGPCLVAIIID